jgi:hypothetical protein
VGFVGDDDDVGALRKLRERFSQRCAELLDQREDVAMILAQQLF